MFGNIASVVTLCLALAYTGWEPTGVLIEEISLDIQPYYLETDSFTWNDQILTWIFIYPEERNFHHKPLASDNYPTNKIEDDNKILILYNKSQPETSLISHDNESINQGSGNILVWKLKDTDQIPTTSDEIEEAKTLGFYVGDCYTAKETDGQLPTNDSLDGDSMMYNGTYLLDSDHAPFYHLRSRYMTAHRAGTSTSDSTNIDHYGGCEINNTNDDDDSWAFTVMKMYLAGLVLKYKVNKIFRQKNTAEVQKKRKRNRQRRKRRQRATGLSKYIGYHNISSLFYQTK